MVHSIEHIALGYTLFICFVLMMPPNQLAAKTLAGTLAALTLTYVFEVRCKYVTPGISHVSSMPGC
jgi:hypothetical protein